MALRQPQGRFPRSSSASSLGGIVGSERRFPRSSSASSLGGIVGGLLKPGGPDTRWRLAFLGGLLAAPLLWRLFAALPEAQPVTGGGMLVVAGLLVGIGTRYGSGCTSGHGVCGLSRLSPRSLAATLTFMGAGFATVYVVRHLLGA